MQRWTHPSDALRLRYVNKRVQVAKEKAHGVVGFSTNFAQTLSHSAADIVALCKACRLIVNEARGT